MSATPVGTESKVDEVTAGPITAFEDQSVQLDVTVPSDIDRPIANPFPDITQPLLTREYLVDSFNWGTTAVNRILTFPDRFIRGGSAWPVLIQMLQMYRYYRSDVEIRIKMETTPYHQGSLLVGYLPCGGLSVAPSLATLSGLNAKVLCASQQDELKFIIPYLSPKDWMDTMDSIPNIDFDGAIGQCFIQTLNTLIPTQANMPTSVPVLVYARFVNMKQMSPVSGITVQPIVAKSHAHFKKNAESSAKQKSGVDTTSIVSTVSGLLKKAPVIGGIYSSAVGVLKSIAPDLSRPLSQAAPIPIVGPYGGQTATCAGLDVATETSMYPNAMVKSSPTFYGMETSHIEVSKLAQRPMLQTSVSLTNVSPIFSTYVSPNVTNDWLWSMAHAFRYWRGSIKYLLHFCVPSFYAFRVQIQLEDQNASAIVQTGDIMSKIVDIKGDTTVTLSVPYMRTHTWTDPAVDYSVGPAYKPPILTVQILTPIVGSSAPATPTIYLNVWRAGGEDTQFAQLKGARTVTNLTAESHMDLNQEFETI